MWNPNSKLAASAFAIAVALLVLPGTGLSSLQAQCVVCNGGDDCADGRGGSTCTSRLERDKKTCTITGGCECTRVEIDFWFDRTECVPADDGPDVQGQQVSPGLDSNTRTLDLNGIAVALRRVGRWHFAAINCNSDDWAFLARELPDGEMAIITNPLAIRWQRWVWDLGLIEAQG